MSFRVLVIPEDPTYNGAILQPLVERMMTECGRPNARVTVLTEPHLRGVSDVKSRIEEILDQYAHFHLLLCLVDADTEDRDPMLRGFEELAKNRGMKLLGCQAEKEVEIWLLAGYAGKLPKSWKEVRDDPSVKENVFEPFLAQYGSKYSRLLSRICG